MASSSPGCTEASVQPLGARWFALVNSAFQFCTWPFSSFTSNSITQCGLVKWKSVTVPFNVTSAVVSKAAYPWCPAAERGTASEPAASARRVNKRFFIARVRRQSIDRDLAHTGGHSTYTSEPSPPYKTCQPRSEERRV